MAVARHALLPCPARARRAACPARLPPARSASSDDPQVSDLVAIATTDKLIESMLEVVDDDSRFAGAVSANGASRRLSPLPSHPPQSPRWT